MYFIPVAVNHGFESSYRRANLIIPYVKNSIADCLNQWLNNEVFAPYTAIIGPSMSGKTRLIMELAQSEDVIYSCFRPPGSKSTPPRSSSVANFLAVVDTKMELKCRAFIIAMLKQTLALKCDQKCDQDSKKPFTTILDPAHDTFWGAVVVESNRLLLSPSPEEKLTDAEWCKQTVSQLDVNLRSHLHGKYLLCAFDEARELAKIRDSAGVSVFRYLRGAITMLPRRCNIFCLFIDTTPEISNFLPQARNEPSLRQVNHSHELCRPITKLHTFDSFAKTQPPASLVEMVDLDRLLCYGLPYFGAVYHNKYKRSEEVISLAKAKLLCFDLGSTRPSGFKWSFVQALAVLGPLVRPTLNSLSLSSELVANHCAQCLYVSDDRSFICSGYGSSYLFSEAAIKILEEKETNASDILGYLVDCMRNGSVSKGDGGELTAKLIMILALIATNRRINNQDDNNQDFRTKIIKVQDFLETLVGESVDGKQKFFGDISDANWNKLLRGSLFFNHFINLQYTPNESDLLNMMYRSAFGFTKDVEKSFDIVGPIYFDEQESSEQGGIDASTRKRTADDFNEPNVRKKIKAERSEGILT